MSYTRVNWQDAPSVSTPLSASNLNKMDAGIEQNANDIEALQQHTYDSALDDTSTNAPQTKAVKKAIEDAVESVTIITDPTLSNEGQAADAKATGEAVAQLKSAITDITGSQIIPLAQNHYIDLSGSTVTMSNGVPQYSDGTTVYFCGMVQCVAGDEFVVNGTGGSSTRLWGFVNSLGSILKVASASASATNLKLIAPTDAAWLIVHTNIRVNSYKGLFVKERVDSIENDFHFENIGVLGAYHGSYTDGKVDSVNGTLTVYAPCKENVVYRISKTATKRFRVFFTQNQPITGESVFGVVANDTGATIETRSPANANYICAYIYSSGTDSSYGTENEIRASLTIKAKGTYDFTSLNGVSALQSKIGVLIDDAAAVVWEQGGIGLDGAAQNDNRRMRTTDYIEGIDLNINIDATKGAYSVRYYNGDTLLQSDSEWRTQKLDNVLSSVPGCNRIKIVLKNASNTAITSANKTDLIGAITIDRVTVVDELNELKNAVSIGFPEAPKEYYVSEINDTALSVRDLQTEPCITFAFITDIHYKSVNGGAEGECLNPDLVDDSITNLNAVLKGCKVDFVFVNGDLTDGNVAKATTKGYVKHIFDGLRRLPVPVLCSIGNHDDNRYSTPIMTSAEMFANYTAQGNMDGINYGSMNGTNYYIDYKSLKIRFIIINSNDFSGHYDFTEETRLFLSEALADMPTGYQGFIFTHTSPGTVMNYNQTVRPHGGDVETIINTSGRVNAVFYGHSHQDNSFGPAGSGALNVYDYLAICSCCEKCTNSNGDPSKWSPNASMPLRTVGTATEDLWDIIVIRPVSRKINYVRFGAGDNREFNY